jgi:hypothetical protein
MPVTSGSDASFQDVHALPFLLAFVSAAILAPAVLRALSEGGHTKANYRDRRLPHPSGCSPWRRRSSR